MVSAEEAVNTAARILQNAAIETNLAAMEQLINMAGRWIDLAAIIAPVLDD